MHFVNYFYYSLFRGWNTKYKCHYFTKQTIIIWQGIISFLVGSHGIIYSPKNHSWVVVVQVSYDGDLDIYDTRNAGCIAVALAMPNYAAASYSYRLCVSSWRVFTGDELHIKFQVTLKHQLFWLNLKYTTQEQQNKMHGVSSQQNQ